MRDGLRVFARGRRATGKTDRDPGRYRRGYDDRPDLCVRHLPASFVGRSTLTHFENLRKAPALTSRTVR